MTRDIQPADPQLRKRFMVVMTCVAILIAFGLHSLDAYLLDLQILAQDAQPTAAAKAKTLVRIVLISLLVGMSVFCLYLVRSSWKILKCERFPPPGSRVLSDTEIRRGPQARRYGQAGLATAILLMLLTIAIAYQASRLMERSFDTTLKPTVTNF